MVNYLLATSEQKDFAENVRKILEKELAPRIEELSEQDGGRGKFPMDVLKVLGDAGYCGMNIPEEWGGLGLDLPTQCLILEEMARVDNGFAFSAFAGSMYFPFILQTKMSHEEKQSWADRLISGESICGFALTEPDAGSDARGVRCSAIQDGNDWILNGTKCFITNGPVADAFFVVAWTDKSKSITKGASLFMVEKKFGIQVGKKEYKMGMHLSETSELIFDNVRIPADHVVGEIGTGYGAAQEWLGDSGRLVDAVCCLGLAQAALDTAVEYTKVRRQFGKRVIDHEGLGFLIADMQIRTAASRALVYETANALEHGIHSATATAVMKTFVTDSTMKTVSDAVQALGGYGYMREYPTERYMRDAKIYQIFGGTNQIQRMVIARALAGKDEEKK